MSKADQLLAEAAFRESHYPAALEGVQRAIARDRDNGRLWLFSAQSHLALDKYSEAIQDIGVAVRVLDRRDWYWVVEQFREFYRNEDYVTEMDRLTQHVESNRDDAAAVGLRGYHYAGLGYIDAAIADLKKAASLAPEEPLYSKLLARLVERAEPAELLPAPKPPGPDKAPELDPPLTLGAPG